MLRWNELFLHVRTERDFRMKRAETEYAVGLLVELCGKLHKHPILGPYSTV